ncbi:MAG: hypothetical protein KC493_17280, partial [Bacteriovoracaceae bacterium]|nr:hypothetical protein [Bacteriovoracaceae bacterium]
IPNKLVTISQEDTITLGKRELKFSLTCEDGQFETVRRFKNLKRTNSFWTLFFIIFSLSIIILSVDDGSISFSNILFSAFFASFCGSIGLFLTRLSKSNNLLISELLIGEHGLTIHYPDSNMSILYSDIDYIIETYGGMVIAAHDGRFNINKLKNYDKLLSFFKKNHPEKFKKSEAPLQIFSFIFVLLLFVVNFFYESLVVNLDLTTDIIVELSIYIALFLFALLCYFNDKYAKIFFIANRANLKNFKRTFAVGMAVFCVQSVLAYYELDYMMSQKKYISDCKQGSSKSCKNLDLRSIAKQKKKKYNVIKISKTACHRGSRFACKYYHDHSNQPLGKLRKKRKKRRVPASASKE